MKNRIDKELVKRGFVQSRSKAQELIKNEKVKCNGKIITKPNYIVSEDDELVLLDNDRLKYVSRGGLKLEKAINEFKLDFNNLNIMDIGSSTGGFTDCSLQHGAKSVTAIDVGSNLLHEKLKNDKRVTLYEKTNFKDVSSDMFKYIDLIVCDVSFISLKKIINVISEQNKKVDIVCLIKPQFECGKDIATKYKGVVLDKKVHKAIIEDLFSFFNESGFYINGFIYSPITGGDGNIEYLVFLTNKISKNKNINTNSVINQAFKSL